MKKSLSVSALLLAVAIAAPALAADDPMNQNASMQSPSTDGAYVVRMPGFVNNLASKNLSGARPRINDGVVIRKSFVQDGKVVIPPEGLYTTSRSGNWHPFNDHQFTIAGKKYHFITDEYQQDVVKNVTMKPGDMIFSDPGKTRGWKLQTIDAKPFGIDGGHMAYFKLVKATGNNYGNDFIIVDGFNIPPVATDGTYVKDGSGLAEGATSGLEQRDPRKQFVGNKVATNNRSVVHVDSVTPDEAKIKELVTISTARALISPNDPVMGEYGKGDTFKLGNATVTVDNVGADSATITIAEGDNKTTKELKVSPEELKLFPASRSVATDMYVLSKDGKYLVNMNPRNEGGLFKDGKVALMGYSDVVDVHYGDKWGADDRFVARPETCAECTYAHEIVLANAEPIVLDAQNNTYKGPEGYFSIVIDEIDGDQVKGWHVENGEGKTDNLAGRAQGKNVDLVLGADCRSTAHFFSRVYPQLYKEAMGVK